MYTMMATLFIVYGLIEIVPYGFGHVLYGRLALQVVVNLPFASITNGDITVRIYILSMYATTLKGLLGFGNRN